MEKILTADLQPGMVTAEPVTTPNGQLIVNKGISLDKKMIARINFYSIQFAMIEEQTEEAQVIEHTSESPATPEVLPEKKPAPEPSSLFLNFETAYTSKLFQIREMLNNLLTQTDFDSKDFMVKALDIIGSQRLTTIELFDHIHNLRAIDDSVYAHSINVALIARILGTWLKYDYETIDQLTIAGLLHDIGKLKVPKNILEKPGKLTEIEFEVIKTHPRMGYETLLPFNLDERIMSAVLHHHERCDGTGYPDRLKGKDIDDFTMIIAVADVYDAMTAARTYRDPMCPFQVIATFEDEGLQKYNPSIILTFLRRMANTYQNNRVVLSDGRLATIVLLNDKHLSRPTVVLDDGSFLDLSTSPIRIVKLV